MRSQVVVVLLGMGLALACDSGKSEPSTGESAPTAEPAPEPASEPKTEVGPPIGAWVVLDDQRGLFKKAGTERVPIAFGKNGLRVAEVVAITGKTVELRTIASATAQACIPGSLGIDPNVQLRFFVELDALQPVLARPKRIEFEGGTKLQLEAGVPVLATGTPGRVRVGVTELVVNLDEQDVARWFPAPTAAPLPPAELREPNRELHYGEHSFVGTAPPFMQAYEEQSIEGGRLLTFADACGRFVLRTGPKRRDGLYVLKGPGDAIPQMARDIDELTPQNGRYLVSPGGDPLGDSEVWGGLSSPCSPTLWTAPGGTAVNWRTGGEAGVVLAAHELPTSAMEHGESMCFEASGLGVCIEKQKLESEKNLECTYGAVVGLGTPPPEPSERKSGGVESNVTEATVSTGLEADIIRRIIRAHVKEVLRCHEAGLADQPTLAGRVEIAFSIDPKGKVASSKVQSSTLEPEDPGVATCIAKAVKRWTFPKPAGGATVDVVYPFVLSAG